MAPILGISAIVLLIVGVIFSKPAFADSVNPGVVSVEDKPYGQTYGDWSAKWWQWALSEPQENNPLFDETGELCSINQGGPVWFLGGAWGTPRAERTCTIPSD